VVAVDFSLKPIRDDAAKVVLLIPEGRAITEQKQAAEVLRLSEERFRGAFDVAAVGIALVAPGGRWLKVNESFCAFLGYSEDELRRTTWQALTHPDDLRTDLASVEATLAGRIEGYTIEKRYLRKDGNTVVGRLNVALVRSPEGEPRYFISQLEDITPRSTCITAAQLEKYGLTQRQLEILQLLADAKSTGEIAEVLHLSKTTVRNHIAHLLTALGVHTRLQAIMAGNRLGLICLPDDDPRG
jgi:PAS domain S-box-containing protein